MDTKGDSSLLKRRIQSTYNWLPQPEQVDEKKSGQQPADEEQQHKFKRLRRAFAAVANQDTDANTIEGLGRYNLMAIRPDNEKDQGADTIFQDAFDALQYMVEQDMGVIMEDGTKSTRKPVLTENAEKLLEAARCGSLIALHGAIKLWSSITGKPDDAVHDEKKERALFHYTTSLVERVQLGFRRMEIKVDAPDHLDFRSLEVWLRLAISRIDAVEQESYGGMTVRTLLAVGACVPADLQFLSEMNWLMGMYPDQIDSGAYRFQPASDWLTQLLSVSLEALGWNAGSDEIWLQPFTLRYLAAKFNLNTKESTCLEFWKRLPLDLFQRYSHITDGAHERFRLIRGFFSWDMNVTADIDAKWQKLVGGIYETAKEVKSEFKESDAETEFERMEAPPLGPKFKLWFMNVQQAMAHYGFVAVSDHYKQLFRHAAAQQVASSNDLALQQPSIADTIASFLGGWSLSIGNGQVLTAAHVIVFL